MTLLSPPFLLELHSLKVDGSARRPLLSDISFTLAAGERLAVIGPNGCGKSTLLKTLVGERRIALPILPSTMRRIRGYALRTTSPSVACRTALAQDSAIIRLAIADVGLAHRTHARIGTLSGGERQRAALARALAQTKPFTSGKYAMPTAIIEAAGGRNILDNLPMSWGTVSWETVAESQPAFIILLDYQASGSAATLRRFLESHPLMRVTPAVRQHRYLALPYQALTPGPANIDAVRALARALYPDAFQ